MLDLIIRNGLVVDGSGLAGRHADVGVAGGRIAAIGRLGNQRAGRVVDAAGMVVAPGIVDIHTHYDPQVTWDPLCDTSGLHGVTTVVAGNCGFSVAPCRPADRGYLAQVFARVEGMDLSALGHVDWRFETFPELMGALEGRLGLNLGMYVGHSALRRYVMGDACYERPSTDEERERIIALTEEAMDAGAMGWSSSRAPVHLDLADRPVPSRLADLDEVRGMADAVGRTGARGSIAYAPESSMEGIDAADRDLMIDLGRRGGVPVITQGLGGRSKIDAPELAWQEAADFLDRSAAVGAPVYCLLMVRGFRGPVHPGAGHHPLRGGSHVERAVPPARGRTPAAHGRPGGPPRLPPGHRPPQPGSLEGLDPSAAQLGDPHRRGAPERAHPAAGRPVHRRHRPRGGAPPGGHVLRHRPGGRPAHRVPLEQRDPCLVRRSPPRPAASADGRRDLRRGRPPGP